MGFLSLKSIKRFGFCASLIALVSACGSQTPAPNSGGLRATSSQQLYDFMIAQSVATKRARDIVRACAGLQINRATIERRDALLNTELDRLEVEDPQVFLEFAARMGIPTDKNARLASRTGRRPTLLELTGLNTPMVADFGINVLFRSTLARSSQSCADGAREMNNGTLTGSFLKPVNAGNE